MLHVERVGFMFYQKRINAKIKFFGMFYSKASLEKCDAILSTYNSFYSNLSDKQKRQFQIRTLTFLNSTNFYSDDNFNLTKSKKIIISSAFAQITFGLNFFGFLIFKDIHITPRSYSYAHSDDLYDGDVNLFTKRVNMSWPAIKSGFEIPDDALNLCIHEFGHCLYFENLKRSYTRSIFKRKYFYQWKSQAEIKMEKINNHKNELLRDYGGTNLVEFFSVALESFYEKSIVFKEKEPELYTSMTKLLNFDPIQFN